MTTLDNLLTIITSQHSEYAKGILNKKDFDILNSLTSSVTGPGFITENQGKLLIKILQENRKKLENLTEEITDALTSNRWSRPFRRVEQIKKLYIGHNDHGDLALVIEFSFSSQIRKIIHEFTSKLENFQIVKSSKKGTATLNEKNIVKMVDALTPLNFDIHETIKTHYEIIKSWTRPVYENQFLLTTIVNPNFQRHITEDLGIETAIDQNIINDRSLRYQYFLENPKNHGENLVECIANRSKSRVWIDRKQHDLTAVISALVDLKRLPVMVVFENGSDDHVLEHLQNLSNSLEKNGIFERVGIYFRQENNEIGSQFNKLISEKQYNYKLDDTTQVVAVQSGKLPKFFLKTSWRPMSIIALNTKMGMRHGKISVYSNCCDCIIEWDDEPVLQDGLRIKVLWP
jgi:hypothetical protein